MFRRLSSHLLKRLSRPEDAFLEHAAVGTPLQLSQGRRRHLMITAGTITFKRPTLDTTPFPRSTCMQRTSFVFKESSLAWSRSSRNQHRLLLRRRGCITNMIEIVAIFGRLTNNDDGTFLSRFRGSDSAHAGGWRGWHSLVTQYYLFPDIPRYSACHEYVHAHFSSPAAPCRG